MGVKLRAQPTRHADSVQIEPLYWLTNLREWRTACDVGIKFILRE